MAERTPIQRAMLGARNIQLSPEASATVDQAATSLREAIGENRLDDDDATAEAVVLGAFVYKVLTDGLVKDGVELDTRQREGLFMAVAAVMVQRHTLGRRTTVEDVTKGVRMSRDKNSAEKGAATMALLGGTLLVGSQVDRLGWLAALGIWFLLLVAISMWGKQIRDRETTEE